MTTEAERTLLEDFLVAGTHDWSDIDFVYSLCTDEGETDPEKLRERALELISEVLFSGLMVAGDVDKTFVPWDLSAAESFARIRNEWMATTAKIYSFDIGWLDLTPAGEARATEILAREGIEWP